ncbi:hypothetical protein PVAP13_2NG234203 [Panicum virgatum]|uniref:Uncharacterized protein n=1 Tax=Panicum virgatum TaxID=38727 RepID=A0A8T0VF55_PANVG|nr:hypothetical protein PVAP13_2NG234203 [Panicum virgatum]
MAKRQQYPSPTVPRAAAQRCAATRALPRARAAAEPLRPAVAAAAPRRRCRAAPHRRLPRRCSAPLLPSYVRPAPLAAAGASGGSKGRGRHARPALLAAAGASGGWPAGEGGPPPPRLLRHGRRGRILPAGHRRAMASV